MPCIDTTAFIECDDLEDVWQMVFNPLEGRQWTGFNTPTLQDTERIEPGNFVQLGRGINKFIARIESNNPCYFRLCGTVIRGDLEDQPFKAGDTICFFYRNVYSISENLECI